MRTISRTQAVWKNFQDYKYILSDKFIDTFTFMAENKAVAQSAKRAHKFNSDVDASVEVFKLGAQYWIYVIDRTRYVFFEYLFQKSYDYDNILPCYSSFLSISAFNSFIFCIFALNKAIQSWQNNSSYEQYSISNNRSRVQAMGNS